jgi:NAD+ synthase
MGYMNEDLCAVVKANAERHLAEYCMKHKIHYIVKGVSGGLDSAVTSVLAAGATRYATEHNRTLISVDVLLPCDSDPEDTEMGRLVSNKFADHVLEVDLTRVNDFFQRELLSGVDAQLQEVLKHDHMLEASLLWPFGEKVAQGNIKARLRMTQLYYMANRLHGMVLSTDNFSEYWMGFWTICGDVGDYAMLQHVLKGLEMAELARYLGVPEEIIARPPSDGLKVNGTDANQLGAEYGDIDKIMIYLIQHGFDPDGENDQLKALPSVPGQDAKTVQLIAARSLRSAYKREGTVMLSRAELGLPEIEDMTIED